MLLVRGAEPDCAEADNRRTALIHCARLAGGDRLSTAQLLLDLGADVELEDGRALRPALHWAVARDDARLARALLAAGADCEHRDGNGHTALLLAAREGSLACARLLIRSRLLNPRTHPPPRP